MYLCPSCLESDSIQRSQRMAPVLQGTTLSLPSKPLRRSRADGGQRQPRVFIGNSLELNAIVFVVLSPFKKNFFNIMLSIAFVWVFFRGLTISYYHPLHFSFKDMW